MKVYHRLFELLKHLLINSRFEVGFFKYGPEDCEIIANDKENKVKYRITIQVIPR